MQGTMQLAPEEIILKERIRVLIVDDSAFMRNALTREIGSDPRFLVVGAACNGKEGVEKALALAPDVITLDVDMPVQGGLDALQELTGKSSAAVIMLSARTHSATAEMTLEALSRGAIDFIPKTQCKSLLHEKLAAAAHARRAPQKTPPSQIIRRDAVAKVPAEFLAKAVVIGSSTGGPRALTELLTTLIGPLRVPVFIAQHMPRSFTPVLAARLEALSGHRVIEPQDGAPVENGVIYIAPGGMHMRVGNGEISIRGDQGESIYQPSIDILTASVLEAFRGSVLGVLLTGLGRDGVREFARLKRSGGWTIAQDAASCAVFGMPKALIDAGGACEVMPPKAIAWRIGALVAKI